MSTTPPSAAERLAAVRLRIDAAAAGRRVRTPQGFETEAQDLSELRALEAQLAGEVAAQNSAGSALGAGAGVIAGIPIGFVRS